MIPSIFSAYFVVSQHSFTLHWWFRAFFQHTLSFPSILALCIDDSVYFFCVHWRFLVFFRLASIIPSIFPLCIDNSEHFSVYIAISQHPCTFTLPFPSILAPLHWRFRVFLYLALTIPNILSPCTDDSEHFFSILCVSQHSFTLHWWFRAFFQHTLSFPNIFALCIDDSVYFSAYFVVSQYSFVLHR